MEHVKIALFTTLAEGLPSDFILLLVTWLAEHPEGREFGPWLAANRPDVWAKVEPKLNQPPPKPIRLGTQGLYNTDKLEALIMELEKLVAIKNELELLRATIK